MEVKFFDALGCGRHVSKVISGWSWLLMGDFNMCVDASQFASHFSLMDDNYLGQIGISGFEVGCMEMVASR